GASLGARDGRVRERWPRVGRGLGGLPEILTERAHELGGGLTTFGEQRRERRIAPRVAHRDDGPERVRDGLEALRREGLVAGFEGTCRALGTAPSEEGHREVDVVRAEEPEVGWRRWERREEGAV